METIIISAVFASLLSFCWRVLRASIRRPMPVTEWERQRFALARKEFRALARKYP